MEEKKEKKLSPFVLGVIPSVTSRQLLCCRLLLPQLFVRLNPILRLHLEKVFLSFLQQNASRVRLGSAGDYATERESDLMGCTF